MHDEPRDKLRELILEYGRSLCDDPRRCEALLKDHCGPYKREIFVLVSALKSRVSDDLLKARSAGLPETMVWSRARQRLEDELAMTAEAAHWAVESWALALGFIVQAPPIARPAPVAPSPQSTAPRAQPTPSSAKAGTAAALLGGRYRDHGNGVINDTKTNLQWMCCLLGQVWKGGTCIGDPRVYTWHDAMKLVERLNRDGGLVHRDWRLPTKHELLDFGSVRLHDSLACMGAHDGFYWTTSINEDMPNNIWLVRFSSGDAYNDYRTNSNYARLVRARLWPI